MATPGGWKVLDLNLLNVPKLLVKSHFDSAGYQVKLTDLSRIWAETLTKDKVLERASNVGSSIDPGEDSKQFSIFLGKIESALNCEDGTLLTLEQSEAGARRSLSLGLTAPLPHPLPSFEWTVQLERLEAEALEVELMSPLISQAAKLKSQIQSLISELQDKDRVISKICDRLETSGNDLTTVFPGVSNIKTSRKKGQREQLAKHVKGLADFDEVAWRERAERADGTGRLGEQAMNEVVHDLRKSSLESEGWGKWWEKVGEESQLRSNFRADSERHDGSTKDDVGKNSLPHDESMQEDEFQRQGTPPHLNRNDPEDDEGNMLAAPPRTHEDDSELLEELAAHHDDDSTTDDEDDLDAPPRKPQPSQRQDSPTVKEAQTYKSASRKKAGALGGRSLRTPPSPAREPAPKEKTPEVKPPSKLGKIGGKPKPSEPTPAEPQSSKSASPPPSGASKMGIIGGRKTKDSSRSPVPSKQVNPPEPAKEPSPRQSRQLTKEPTLPPRETSQERADRKRDQLKRELEEKAKAPMKKKRKF